MSPRATPRLRAAVWLTAAGIAAALAGGRPEPAALAAPFAVLALVGLRRQRPRRLDARLRLQADRVLEGERVDGVLELAAAEASGRLEAELVLPAGLTLAQQERRALALGPGQTRTLELAIDCERWGAYAAGLLRVRSYDRLRLLAEDYELDLGQRLRVDPPQEALRALARPARTQAAVGDQVARSKGEGIEPAEQRPFAEGDDLRRINWRTTARTGQIVVNELHAERNAAVVLLLDAHAELGTRANPLDRGVRAAVALAARYLARRDRVGLLVLGGVPRWLRPAAGSIQLHRILDTLLEVRAVAPAGEAAAPLHVPSRLIPPRTLVLALSPLLDGRIVATLGSLHGRGFDLAVVELPPLPYLPLGDEQAELAAQLLRLERELTRSRLRAHGIAVVEWADEASLEATIRAIEEFRRRARVAHG